MLVDGVCFLVGGAQEQRVFCQVVLLHTLLVEELQAVFVVHVTSTNAVQRVDEHFVGLAHDLVEFDGLEAGFTPGVSIEAERAAELFEEVLAFS
ncbi:hypothetical protein D3C76_1267870 [compost metagenome]